MKKIILVLSMVSIWSCQNTIKDTSETSISPLIKALYSADPSAHVFDGNLYVYPSHDVDAGVPEDDLGSHFDMRDYHVYQISKSLEATDLGEILNVNQIPWAEKQLWAPDAAMKNGTYYFYFPAKDSTGIFRIGVATAPSPQGPFVAEPKPIPGAVSIDPCVYVDDDGAAYMYFGGIWGGQLQRWESGTYVSEDIYPTANQTAIMPKMAKMTEDMLALEEPPQDILLLDQEGNPLKAGDNERRFFEAAWVHKFNDTYYFSYSTGDTHNIAYATGTSPMGPFTYQGIILKPVLGWTNHHSIVEFEGQWYLFFHDSELSGGKTHLRNVKVTPLEHLPDGSIKTIDALVNVSEKN